MNNEPKKIALCEIKDSVDANLTGAAAIIDCVRVISEKSGELVCRADSLSLALHHALKMIDKSKADVASIEA
ncbi:hypothetical protein [Herbaspirillum sp. NPDC101396]|uniref:hypothetical protein n=1 Tax=Herbaspirillum sp. NPDC101396 TaxID=3364005 RepID=UPI00383B1BA3